MYGRVCARVRLRAGRAYVVECDVIHPGIVALSPCCAQSGAITHVYNCDYPRHVVSYNRVFGNKAKQRVSEPY